MKNLFDSKGLYGLLLNPDVCPNDGQYNHLVFGANQATKIKTKCPSYPNHKQDPSQKDREKQRESRPPPIFKVKRTPINDKNRLSPNLANKGIIRVSSPRFVSVSGNLPLRIKRNLFEHQPPKHEGGTPKAGYSGQAKISESARVALFRKDPVFIHEHSQQEQPRNGDIPLVPFQENSGSIWKLLPALRTYRPCLIASLYLTFGALYYTHSLNESLLPQQAK
ncbi:hypothetical protein OAK38_09525 [Verrucomicrobia bacterium]|nr:hypothetical protein [Verrucomicrobiota bacterium]